uniref:Piwi domain-containing protein n=1 Tax=Heterorhabditis bacteriophora TaxID=37862 RepID=A0A1I7XJ60_HETBA
MKSIGQKYSEVYEYQVIVTKCNQNRMMRGRHRPTHPSSSSNANLLTQHIRYYPEQNNLRESHFKISESFHPHVILMQVVNKLFYKPKMNLITYYFDVLQDLGFYKDCGHSISRDMAMNRKQRQTMTDKLSGIRVKTNCALLQRSEGTPFLAKRTYKFIKVADSCPGVFKMSYGKTIEETYYLLGRRLLYPGLPLCEVKNGNTRELLPLEVLDIHEKPQSYNKTLDFLTKLKFIKEGVPVEVDADNRSFKMKQLNGKLLIVKKHRFLVIEYRIFQRVLQCVNRKVPGKKHPHFREASIGVRTAVEKAKSLFDQGRDKNNEILLILVFHSRVYNTYGLVKSLCDNEYGIVSQVVDEESVRKAVSGSNLSIYYNLALKINAKLGGVNHSTVMNGKLTGENTGSNKKSGSVMYVGIDVTHPTNTSELTDTWARLTEGTLQPTFTYIVIQKRHLTRFYNILKDGEKEMYVKIQLLP